MAHGETLREAIWRLIREGKLTRRIRRKDLFQNLGGQFSWNYLNGALGDYCEGTGDYVKKGCPPLFRKISRGLYEVI